MKITTLHLSTAEQGEAKNFLHCFSSSTDVTDTDSGVEIRINDPTGEDAELLKNVLETTGIYYVYRLFRNGTDISMDLVRKRTRLESWSLRNWYRFKSWLRRISWRRQ